MDRKLSGCRFHVQPSANLLAPDERALSRFVPAHLLTEHGERVGPIYLGSHEPNLDISIAVRSTART